MHSSDQNNDNHLASSKPPKSQSKYNKDDPLAPPPVKASKTDNASSPPVTGRIRILVSYQPTGLERRQRNVVALEAFARRSLTVCTCRPLLQPLLVTNRHGSYLL